MTEYEMASLHSQISGNLGSQLTNFLTIVSLYLGAGYLVSHRMSFSAAVTFSSMFVLVSLAQVFTMFNTMRSWTGLAAEMHSVAAKGGALAWHSTANLPSSVPTFGPIGGAVIFSVVVAAAVYFFFASRRYNKRLEAQASVSNTTAVEAAIAA